jgi:hypothetical protein
MDVSMVSYYDRSVAVFPVLHVAATRLLEDRRADGSRFFTLLQNPRRGFVWLAEHGWFRGHG